MKNLKPYQLQLLDLVSFALFGEGKCDTPLTSEVLKEANQQAVLTLSKSLLKVIHIFYSNARLLLQPTTSLSSQVNQSLHIHLLYDSNHRMFLLHRRLALLQVVYMQNQIRHRIL